MERTAAVVGAVLLLAVGVGVGVMSLRSSSTTSSDTPSPSASTSGTPVPETSAAMVDPGQEESTAPPTSSSGCPVFQHGFGLCNPTESRPDGSVLATVWEPVPAAAGEPWPEVRAAVEFYTDGTVTWSEGRAGGSQTDFHGTWTFDGSSVTVTFSTETLPSGVNANPLVLQVGSISHLCPANPGNGYDSLKSTTGSLLLGPVVC